MSLVAPAPLPAEPQSHMQADLEGGAGGSTNVSSAGRDPGVGRVGTGCCGRVTCPNMSPPVLSVWPQDYMQNIHGKEIDLLRTTVKVPGKRLPRATPATAPGTSPRANGLALERSSTQLGGGTGEGLLRWGRGAHCDRGVGWAWEGRRQGAASSLGPQGSGQARTECQALGSAQLACWPKCGPRGVSRGSGQWTARRIRAGTGSLRPTGGVSVRSRAGDGGHRNQGHISDTLAERAAWGSTVPGGVFVQRRGRRPVQQSESKTVLV